MFSLFFLRICITYIIIKFWEGWFCTWSDDLVRDLNVILLSGTSPATIRPSAPFLAICAKNWRHSQRYTVESPFERIAIDFPINFTHYYGTYKKNYMINSENPLNEIQIDIDSFYSVTFNFLKKSCLQENQRQLTFWFCLLENVFLELLWLGISSY